MSFSEGDHCPGIAGVGRLLLLLEQLVVCAPRFRSGRLPRRLPLTLAPQSFRVPLRRRQSRVDLLDDAIAHAEFLLEDALPLGVHLLYQAKLNRTCIDLDIERTLALEHAVDRNFRAYVSAFACDSEKRTCG